MDASRKEITCKEVNHKLPPEGFVRINQLCNHKGTPGILSISKSSFWAGVREGRFPAPVHLGPRTTAWRVQDIRALIDGEAA